MKKLLALSALTLAISSTVQAEDFFTYATSTYTTGKHGAVNVTSNHGVSIRNKTGLTQTYHVTYDNAVYYGKARQLPLDYSNNEVMVPNAHIEYDVTLAPNKEFHFGAMPIGKNAYFEKAGRYRLQASTIIKLKEIVVAAHTDYNVAEIY